MDKTLLQHRHRKIRSRIYGTADRPRVCVSKSLTRMSAQIVDDDAHQTLGAAYGTAEEVGKSIGEQAKKLGITQVVFDRGGYRYHGKVKAIADSIREVGITL